MTDTSPLSMKDLLDNTRARELGGIVVLPDGRPVAGARIAVSLPSGFRFRFAFPLDDTEDQSWDVETGPDGRFVLGAVPVLAGCTMRVTKTDYAPRERNLDVSAVRVRVVLYPLVTAAGELHGVVVDATGNPVAGACVALGPAPRKTGADGRFRFLVTEPAQERIFALDGEMPVSAEQTMHRHELLWRKIPTDAAGRYTIEGLLDREYEVRAVDEETTEIAVRNRVRAGSKGVAIRFAAGALLPELTGRLVDRHGRPVAGVQLQVERIAFEFGSKQYGGHAWICQARGARARTGADGTFRLVRVPREGIELRLYGKNLFTDEFRFPSGIVTSPVTIPVLRTCRIRVDVNGSRLAAADRIEVVDAAGNRLLLERRAANRIWSDRHMALTDGRSEVLAIPGNATEVVFRKDKDEIGRLPVAPDPRTIVVVRD